MAIPLVEGTLEASPFTSSSFLFSWHQELNLGFTTMLYKHTYFFETDHFELAVMCQLVLRSWFSCLSFLCTGFQVFNTMGSYACCLVVLGLNSEILPQLKISTFSNKKEAISSLSNQMCVVCCPKSTQRHSRKGGILGVKKQ